MDQAELLAEIPHVFPIEEFNGVVAPHDCDECNMISATLRGLTWREVTREFLEENQGIQPLLSPDAYVAFLPAWIRFAIEDPDSLIASDLMNNLSYDPDVVGFSNRQQLFVVRAAEYVLANNCYGDDDPVNKSQLREIREKWLPEAARRGDRSGR